MCFLIFVVSVYSTSLHGSRMFSIVFIWKGASNTFKNNVSGFWLAIAKGFVQASLVHLGFQLLLSSEQLLGDLLLLLLRSLLFSLPHHLFEHRPGSAWLPWTNVCVHLALGKCLQDHFLLGVREFVWLKVFFKVDGQLSPWNLRVLLHGGLNGFQAPSWFRLMLKLQLTHQPVRPCHLPSARTSTDHSHDLDDTSAPSSSCCHETGPCWELFQSPGDAWWQTQSRTLITISINLLSSSVCIYFLSRSIFLNVSWCFYEAYGTPLLCLLCTIYYVNI